MRLMYSLFLTKKEILEIKVACMPNGMLNKLTFLLGGSHSRYFFPTIIGTTKQYVPSYNTITSWISWNPI